MAEVRGGGGGGIVPDPLGRLLSSVLLPSAVIFLGLFFYRARVLEISPFSLEKPVDFLEILSRDYTSPENSSYGFLPFTHSYIVFCLLRYVRFVIE